MNSVGPGKATATEVLAAFAPSDVYCNLGLWGADVAMIYCRNQPPWGCSLGGTSGAIKSKGLLGQRVYMWMSWPSHLCSVVRYSLGNPPISLL